MGISKRRSEQFIRTVPREWARRSWSLPGKAAAVGQAIWFRAGVQKSQIVTVPYLDLKSAGISERTARRALQALEAADLVTVDRNRGRSPLVTILEVGEVSQ